MLVSQHTRVDAVAIKLQNYIKQLEDWFTTNRMPAEGSNFSLPVVAPYTWQLWMPPALALIGQSIPVNANKNILSDTNDRAWLGILPSHARY